jgi:hypothetical protein
MCISGRKKKCLILFFSSIFKFFFLLFDYSVRIILVFKILYLIQREYVQFLTASICSFIDWLFHSFFYFLIYFKFLALLFRVDVQNKSLCVFDNCSRFFIDDCLQHDMESMKIWDVVVKEEVEVKKKKKELFEINIFWIKWRSID